MYTKVDIDSHLEASVSQPMGRLQLRARRYRYLLSSHQITLRFLVLLTSICCTMLTVFSLVLYANSHSISKLFDDWSGSRSGRQRTASTTTLIPSVFKRLGMTVIDQSIVYDEFDYLKPESLTHKSRTYANDVQILFRFPKKKSVTALLLIFHGCSRSAHDWFHTIERQRIIGAAIDLGYACLAFQSTNTVSRCWAHDIDIYENLDVKMVFKGLTGFFEEFPKLGGLNMWCFVRRFTATVLFQESYRCSLSAPQAVASSPVSSQSINDFVFKDRFCSSPSSLRRSPARTSKGETILRRLGST